MQEGNRRDYSDPMLVSPQVRISTEDRHPELNTSQRQAADEIFLSREKVVGLDGIAGAGKTTTLSVIREGAEAEGWTPSWALRICSTAAWPTSLSRVNAMTRRFIRTMQRLWAMNSAATCPICHWYSYALRDRFVFLSDLRTRFAMKLAKGLASTSMLARSRAFRYSARSSTRTTVHGYPPEASRTFISKRAMRPLPSG
jgi:hypothetical protein